MYVHGWIHACFALKVLEPSGDVRMSACADELRQVYDYMQAEDRTKND